MNDKTYDLLEKMYIQFNNRFDNLENRFDNLENRFDNLENRFDDLEQVVKKNSENIIRIENKIDNKFGALFWCQ